MNSLFTSSGLPLLQLPRILLESTFEMMAPRDLFVFYDLSLMNKRIVKAFRLAATFSLSFTEKTVEILVSSRRSDLSIFRVSTNKDGSITIDAKVDIFSKDFIQIQNLDDWEDWTFLFAKLCEIYWSKETKLDNITINYTEWAPRNAPLVKIKAALEVLRNVTGVNPECETVHFFYPSHIMLREGSFLHILKIKNELRISTFPKKCPNNLLCVPRVHFLRSGSETVEQIMLIQSDECTFYGSHLTDKDFNTILRGWMDGEDTRNFRLTIHTDVPPNLDKLEESLKVRDRDTSTKNQIQFTLVREDGNKASVQRNSLKFIFKFFS